MNMNMKRKTTLRKEIWMPFLKIYVKQTNYYIGI
jgi:hypothetical protein